MIRIRYLISTFIIIMVIIVSLFGIEFSPFILSDSEVSETVGKLLIQKTGAQLSMIIFPDIKEINKLKTKEELVKEIRKLGKIKVVELSGKEIKEILEDVGRVFNYNGMNFEIKEGIFAILEGLEYIIDLTKLDGEKVVLLKNQDGSDVKASQVYKVAVLGPLFEKKNVIGEYGDINEYLETEEVSDPKPDMNWQVYFKPFFFNYMIRPGDTLWKLSQRFHTTIPTIMYFNKWINDPNMIYAFWNLKIHVGKWK